MSTTTAGTVASQVTDDLDATLVEPLRALLGLDIADLTADRIQARSPSIAAAICQDDDDRLAAGTVMDIMGVLWPHAAPETVGRADWWRTPLGRQCARVLGRDDAESVTRTVAAAMLGLHPGSIAQMVHRGTLDRHPDGGVLRASVLQRLGR